MGYFGIDVKKFLDDYFGKHDEELMQRMEEVIGENEDPMEISALADWVFRNYIAEAFSNAIKRNNEQIYDDVNNMLTALEDRLKGNGINTPVDLKSKYTPKLKDLNTFSNDEPKELVKDIKNIVTIPDKSSKNEPLEYSEKKQTLLGSGGLPSLDKFVKPLESAPEKPEKPSDLEQISKTYEMPTKMQPVPPTYPNSGNLRQEKIVPVNQKPQTYFDSQNINQKNNLYKQSNVVMESPLNPFNEVASRVTKQIPQFMQNINSSKFNTGEPIGGTSSENNMKKFKFAFGEEESESPTDIMDTGELPPLYEDENEEVEEE